MQQMTLNCKSCGAPAKPELVTTTQEGAVNIGGVSLPGKPVSKWVCDCCATPNVVSQSSNLSIGGSIAGRDMIINQVVIK